MNTYRQCLVALFCALLALPVAARNDATRHYFGVDATAGYSRLFVGNAKIETKGCPSGSLGMNYEFIHNSLWLRTGLEAQYLRQRSSYTSDLAFICPITDTQGKTCQMRYDISGYNELDQFVYLDVPLMVGYLHPEGFYIGGGLRLGFCTWAKGAADYTYTTSGIYEQYIDAFTSMPNHYYTNISGSNSPAIKERVKVNAIFEIGYDVLAPSRYGVYDSHCHRLTLGVFAEMGINSSHQEASETTLLTPNANNSSILQANYLYDTAQGASTYLFPVNIGFRIAYYFRISTPRSKCNCHN